MGTVVPIDGAGFKVRDSQSVSVLQSDVMVFVGFFFRPILGGTAGKASGEAAGAKSGDGAA